MSAAAACLESIPAQLSIGFGRRQSETELLLDRSSQKPTYAVLLPVGCLHDLGDRCAVALVQQRRTRSCFVLRADASAFGCFAGVADDFAGFGLGFDLFVPLAASLASLEELASSAFI